MLVDPAPRSRPSEAQPSARLPPSRCNVASELIDGEVLVYNTFWQNLIGLSTAELLDLRAGVDPMGELARFGFGFGFGQSS